MLKVDGYYQFPTVPLDLSASFRLQSGTPISKMGWYGWNGTRGITTPAAPTGAPRPRGPRPGRAVRLPAPAKRLGDLGLRLDVFNVTNNQATTSVYQTWAIQTYSGGPWFQETKYWSKPNAHQPPRLLRLGLRWTF